jgi:hypothetical protein
MSSPMEPLGGGWYWAGRGFIYRGLWRWNGRRNVRVIPLNRFRQWSGPKRRDR